MFPLNISFHWNSLALTYIQFQYIFLLYDNIIKGEHKMHYIQILSSHTSTFWLTRQLEKGGGGGHGKDRK